MLLGHSLYFILMDFYLFAFCGWVYECIFVFIRDKKPINRGFLVGPILPLYGFGAVTVYLVLLPFSKIPTLLYLMGMLLATVLEYVTAWLLEVCFHTKWWDYSNEPYNFQGRIALIPSMFWGVLSLVMFDVLQPVANYIITAIPKHVGRIGLSIAMIVTACDLIYTVVTMVDLRKQLEKLYEFKKELDYHFMEMTESSLKELLAYSGEDSSRWTMFLKKNPWIGNRRILDAFPGMRLLSKKYESVSVRELLANVKEKSENLSENIRQKREVLGESLREKKDAFEESIREKGESLGANLKGRKK